MPRSSLCSVLAALPPLAALAALQQQPQDPRASWMKLASAYRVPRAPQTVMAVEEEACKPHWPCWIQA